MRQYEGCMSQRTHEDLRPNNLLQPEKEALHRLGAHIGNVPENPFPTQKEKEYLLDTISDYLTILYTNREDNDRWIKQLLEVRNQIVGDKLMIWEASSIIQDIIESHKKESQVSLGSKVLTIAKGIRAVFTREKAQ